MKASELVYLGYITAIANVESILEHGILSHQRASRLKHVDISMSSVQDIRAKKEGSRRYGAACLRLHLHMRPKRHAL
jgi:hypothetical protein